MKKVMLMIALITGVYWLSFAQEGNRIIVNVDNIKSTEGTVRVAIFNSKKEFLNKPFLSQAKISTTGEMKFEFNEVPNGEYTLSSYQDVNENGELDKNFMGIPNEPYGISKEGKQMFGPPSYSEAMFTIVNTNARLTISLD